MIAIEGNDGMLTRIAGGLALLALVAGCAEPPPQSGRVLPPGKTGGAALGARAAGPSFTFEGRVMTKAGRCHTIVTAGRRYAVDRGALRKIPVGAIVRVRARRTKRQICPGSTRILAARVQRLPDVAAAEPGPKPLRVFTNPRSGGLPLDRCIEYGEGCQLAAATDFCRRKGYQRAVAARTYVSRVTRVHRSGEVCRTGTFRQCRAYRWIRCSRG